MSKSPRNIFANNNRTSVFLTDTFEEAIELKQSNLPEQPPYALWPVCRSERPHMRLGHVLTHHAKSPCQVSSQIHGAFQRTEVFLVPRTYRSNQLLLSGHHNETVFVVTSQKNQFRKQSVHQAQSLSRADMARSELCSSMLRCLLTDSPSVNDSSHVKVLESSPHGHPSDASHRPRNAS